MRLEPPYDLAADWLKATLASGPLYAKELRDRLEAEPQEFGMSTAIWALWLLVSEDVCEITPEYRIKLR